MIYYTADTHFGHTSILGMCKRPFRTIHAMDRALIERWNECVKPDDTVYHLGDFAFGPVSEGRKYFDLLNGKKHLIVGNHDRPGIRDWPWESVSEMLMLDDAGKRIFLCHYPLAEWPSSYRGVHHFFGHVHGRRSVPGAVDVGVDLWGYAPVTADAAIAAIAVGEERARKRSIFDFGSELVRQVAERADSWLETWEREHLANAIDEAAMYAIDDIARQRVDQSGG
ncbi:metallophosphoesterase [Aurantimonas sp. HBX-1]|uniref:metallophosphoesterase n=1 Tax=Aurantimonas sp. HBX-1 TaxID=2906072 RepID=UPI001F419A81|nr:metallophosphoesterase [Aurantimonas sp. HBX-1]UIJ73347.1 metallophosphoesterase [Aurantimonas sp. HBX-1]